MNLIDYILVAVVILIISFAVYAIYRSKKNGKKCIGCPNSGTCPSANGGKCNCNN